MALLRHDVHLPYFSQLPRDVAINTFWTTGSGNAETEAAAAHLALTDFYAAVPGDEESAIRNYLSVVINGAACRIKSYDQADPEPRTPVLESAMPLTINDVASFPEEVAICASFKAAYQPGTNRQRYRGRVYLGPLNSNSSETTGDRMQVGLEFSAVVVAAMEDLATALDGSPAWAVYSRVDDAARPVVGGWVDRIWDTQRRRGVELPLGRDTWGDLT